MCYIPLSFILISHILLAILTRVVPFVTIEITCWDSIRASDLANDFSLYCLWISFFPKYLLVFSHTVPYKVSTMEGKKNKHPLKLLLNFSVMKPVKYLISIRQLVWPLPFISFVSLLPCAPFIALCFLVVVSKMAWGHRVTLSTWDLWNISS